MSWNLEHSQYSLKGIGTTSIRSHKRETKNKTKKILSLWKMIFEKRMHENRHSNWNHFWMQCKKQRKLNGRQINISFICLNGHWMEDGSLSWLFDRNIKIKMKYNREIDELIEIYLFQCFFFFFDSIPPFPLNSLSQLFNQCDVLFSIAFNFDINI